MLKIDGEVVNSQLNDFGIPVLRLGFRPFFLAASIFSIIAMAIWTANYIFQMEFGFSTIPPTLWHAHEMLFGYALAVIAGFLLTAIKNWTGEEVLRGKALACLFLLWLIARVLPLTGFPVPIEIIAAVNVVFLFSLTTACLLPVLKVKQYKQLGIISKLFLLMLCDIVFFLGLTGVIEKGVEWGLYSALYMIIALILVMMRRVMPMFIKNGVEGEVNIRNHAWIDQSSLVFLVCLWIADVFTSHHQVTALLAVSLTILHTIRLHGWYTNKIWRKPLVWILVLAYAFIITGFALTAAAVYFNISPFLSVHAYTVGGVGLISIGMMSRVSLGHTGRSVFEPPAAVFWSLLILVIAAVVRVVLPLFFTDFYMYWIGLSQVLWILAFSIFVYVYTPMFLRARVDGRDG